MKTVSEMFADGVPGSRGASIAHLSIPATQPQQVAEQLAPVFDGVVFAFPVVPGAFVIVSRNGSGVALEVLPEGASHSPGTGMPAEGFAESDPKPQPWEVQIRVDEHRPGFMATHAAITTPLSAQDVLNIGRNAGWRALSCERAGVFGVVELWVENRFLLELLPAEQAVRYQAFMNPQGCEALFGPPISSTKAVA